MMHNLLERRTAHLEVTSITRCFKQVLTTLELATTAVGGGYKIITGVQYLLD